MRLLIRPAGPGDRRLVDRFVRGLSEATRYRRFHTGVPWLTDRQLSWLVDVDHHDRETLLAFAGGTLVGVGQYVRDGGGHADVAVVVADAWQRRGVGRALSERLGRAALEAGITAFGASVLADNVAPVRLAHSVNSAVVAAHDRTALDLTIPLRPAA